MKVKLVGYTQPAEEFKDDFSSVKDLVAFCARVSNPTNQFNTATSDKLIKYLIKHKHWSPLEMASATLEIETTRDIARQLLRHRSFSFQEFSQRYADPTKDLDFEYRDARLQDLQNRQNSIITDNTELDTEWKNKQKQILDLVKVNYKWAIDNGIAKEQARAILPEGMTKSRLYVSGTIRSYIHYIEVRTEESTQLEHRQLAQAVSEAILKIFEI
ncbi:MAG: thymidylate synthase (FAD) [Gammaproteobacteria bacterium CG_4_9_14_3_um_filter_38_9]|nr:MAG: thymidylate synthase (FAD) [Gammaproteobacteria bacterium CG_4_9_14_3_um_filter_38_9]